MPLLVCQPRCISSPNYAATDWWSATSPPASSQWPLGAPAPITQPAVQSLEPKVLSNHGITLSTSIWRVGGRHGGPREGEQEASNCRSVRGEKAARHQKRGRAP